MPNAADPAIRGGQLPLSHNPLLRLNYSTPKPAVDLGDIAAKLLEFVENLLLDAIKDVTGLDLSSPEAFWNSIVAIVTQTFTGIDGGLAQLEEWAHTVAEDAEEALNNFAELIDRALGTGHSVEDFVLWLENFLTPNSALNASNLWGLLPAGVSIKVPSTAVTSEQAQPLWNPNFEGSISFEPLAGWAWDSTVYFETSTNLPGSAAVTADGAVHALRSNPFPVDSGQRLTPTPHILTSGLVCTGSPIKLDVITYLGDTQVAIVELVSMGAPTGATTGWTNPPSGSKAGTMSATYTVPDDGTVDAVKLRIVIDSTATAGTVRFGAVPTVIEGGLISDLQSDLTTIQEDETAKAAATATLWQDIGTAITTYGLTDWEAMAVAINAAYQTWNTIVTGIDASEDETILNMLSELLGINLLTGGNTGAEAAQAAANAQLVWWQRLSEDLWILADLFHVYYPLGSPSDTATTTSGGKRTYYSAQADIKLLFNQSQSTTPPSLTLVDPGSQITTAQTTANTAQSTLNTTNTNLFGSTTPGSTITTAAVPSGIPATKISNVLGGANLGADVSSVHSTATTNTTNLSSTWSWLFGTTTPTSSNQVQSAAVQGTQGITDISTTIQNTWDSIATQVAHYLGLDAVSGSDNPLSTVQDVLGQHASQTATALTQAGTNTNTIASLQPSIAQPLLTGPQPTQVASSCQLSDVVFATTSIAAAGTGLLAFTTFHTDTPIDSFTFACQLSSATVPTTFVVNLYSVNASTGAMTRIYTSGNVVSSVQSFVTAGSTHCAYLTLTLPSEIVIPAGSSLATDFAVSGSGNVTFVCASTFAPPFPGVHPATSAATRAGGTTSPTSLAVTDITIATTTPWVGFNGPGAVYNYPVLRKITSSGTVTAPSWARVADVVILGGGSSGGAGLGFPGNAGGTTTAAEGSNSLSATGGAVPTNATTGVQSNSTGAGAPTEFYTPPGATVSDSFPGSTNVAYQKPGSFPGGGGGGGYNGAGAFGYGGNCGNWNTATWTLTGGETFTVTIGAGGTPTTGQGVGAQNGAAGVAYIVFRAS